MLKNNSTLVVTLKEYIKNNKTILFGYLFGSYANKTHNLNSDVDIVVLKDSEQRFDFEVLRQHDILDYKEFKRMIDAA